jgi:hypothetical protein
LTCATNGQRKKIKRVKTLKGAFMSQVNPNEEKHRKPSDVSLKALLIEYRAFLLGRLWKSSKTLERTSFLWTRPSNDAKIEIPRVSCHKIVEGKDRGLYKTENMNAFLWYQIDNERAMACTTLDEFDQLKQEGVRLMVPRDPANSVKDVVCVSQHLSKITRRFAISKATYTEFLVSAWKHLKQCV